MARYKKKPVEVEAIQFGNRSEFSDWAKEVEVEGWYFTFGGALIIETLEGAMKAHAGDWVIRGVEGELYPCKDSVFRATYEGVE